MSSHLAVRGRILIVGGCRPTAGTSKMSRPPSSDVLAAALRESEQKFSVIFQNAPFGISLATLPEQIIVDVNPAWQRLFGFALEEAMGKTLADLQITDEPEG